MRIGENYGVFPTLWDFVDWLKLREVTDNEVKEIEYAKVPENYIYIGLPTREWLPATKLIEHLYHYQHMSGYSTTFSVSVRGARREIEVYQFYVMYVKTFNNTTPESLEELKAADAIHFNPDSTSYVHWLNP